MTVDKDYEGCNYTQHIIELFGMPPTVQCSLVRAARLKKQTKIK